jgi:arginine utilization protein RocB
MVPFIVSIIIASVGTITPVRIMFVALAMLVWNLSYGLLPNYFLSLNANAQLRDEILKNPDKLFIVEDKVQIANEVFYFKGFYPNNILYCPSYYKLKNKSDQELVDMLRNCIDKKKEILTDCVCNEKIFSRASYLKGDIDRSFFSKYTIVPFDSMNTDVGMKKLCKVDIPIHTDPQFQGK